jgi:glycosyltransferase involved in cell wall biosynthesis
MDELAKAIGGERKNIQLGYLPRYLAPFKYVIFFLMTQVYLLKERPRVVFAQNPPVFCPLACVPYCKLTNAKLVVDHHNVWSVKVFGQSRLSSQFRTLERLLALSADANTVPHSVWQHELLRLGAKRVLMVHDYVSLNESARSKDIREDISKMGLIGIASGHQGYPQERVEAEALAAESVEGVTLAITGPPQRLVPRIEKLGSLRNVRYLGYLPKVDYERLKASCDFALNISDEPFTLNHVLFEYAAASLPTISTRRDVIEDVFGDSLLYVDVSDAEPVAARLRELTGSPVLLQEYKSRIKLRFSELTELHKSELAELLKHIEDSRN